MCVIARKLFPPVRMIAVSSGIIVKIFLMVVLGGVEGGGFNEGSFDRSTLIRDLPRAHDRLKLLYHFRSYFLLCIIIVIDD